MERDENDEIKGGNVEPDEPGSDEEHAEECTVEAHHERLAAHEAMLRDHHEKLEALTGGMADTSTAMHSERKKREDRLASRKRH